jgi:peptide/nickel transport system permease protein
MTDGGAENGTVLGAPPAPVAPPIEAIPRPSRRSIVVPPFAILAGWRFAGAVATILAAAVLIYFILALAPRPDTALPSDFLGWLGGALIGNFGLSDTQGFDIGPILAERLAVTVPLVLLAFLPAVLIGLPLGYAAARHGGTWIDKLLSGLAAFGTAFAGPWLAMLLVLLFASTLRWLPPGGFIPWLQNPIGALGSLVLPALALALPLAGALALSMRDALAAAQRAPMMQTAHVLGISPREAVHRHALPNALAAAAATLSLQVALLVPASVIVENVFYLPGLGRLIDTALAERDVTALRAGLVALVALIALARFGTGLLHAWLDPRSRVTP